MGRDQQRRKAQEEVTPIVGLRIGFLQLCKQFSELGNQLKYMGECIDALSKPPLQLPDQKPEQPGGQGEPDAGPGPSQG